MQMEDMNQTRVHYLYRGASNWKFLGAVVVDGELTLERLQPYLFDKEFFVPHEVGLNHLLDQPMNEDDHYLHAFIEFEPVSGLESLCTSADFVARFRSAHERDWFFDLV